MLKGAVNIMDTDERKVHGKIYLMDKTQEDIFLERINSRKPGGYI